MPDPVTVGTAVSIGSSLLSGVAGLGANRAAEKAARRKAELTLFQRNEENRRLGRQYRQVMGENRARVFASNLMMSGSSQTALNDLQKEFTRDLTLRSQAAGAERQAIRATGKSSDLAVLGNTALNIGNAIVGLG